MSGEYFTQNRTSKAKIYREWQDGEKEFLCEVRGIQLEIVRAVWHDIVERPEKEQEELLGYEVVYDTGFREFASAEETIKNFTKHDMLDWR